MIVQLRDVTNHHSDGRTQSPVREVFQELHVSRDGEDVHEVEKDVHYEDNSQMDQTLQADVPHLPFFSGQVGLIGL